MIAFVAGKIEEKEPTHVILNVHGLGYELKISLQTFSAIEKLKEVKLHTYFHVKEDIQQLYGFYSPLEKEIFMRLISISGVGPGTGLVILSSMNHEELREAIAQENVSAIKSIKGIGLKTAQRIILELKDKMRNMSLSEKSDISETLHNTLRSEAFSALTTLGFSKSLAEKKIDQILKSHPDISLEDLIKNVLKSA